MEITRLGRIASCVSLLSFALTANAGTISIGQGSSLDFGGATINAPSTSLTNNGNLNLGSSVSSFLDFTTLSAANTEGGTALVQIVGTWSNDGDFAAGSSAVRFIDGGSGISRILGASTFSTLSAISASGKTVVFESAQQQVVTDQLDLLGANGNLLNIVSTSTGTEAFLSLNPGATQQVQFVNVSDNHGVAQVIAPGTPGEYNSVQGLNVRGWFGTPLSFAIPALSVSGLVLLSLLMLLVVAYTQRSRGDLP